jgi:hypothetical protein
MPAHAWAVGGLSRGFPRQGEPENTLRLHVEPIRFHIRNSPGLR